MYFFSYFFSTEGEEGNRERASADTQVKSLTVPLAVCGSDQTGGPFPSTCASHPNALYTSSDVIWGQSERSQLLLFEDAKRKARYERMEWKRRCREASWPTPAPLRTSIFDATFSPCINDIDLHVLNVEAFRWPNLSLSVALLFSFFSTILRNNSTCAHPRFWCFPKMRVCDSF